MKYSEMSDAEKKYTRISVLILFIFLIIGLIVDPPLKRAKEKRQKNLQTKVFVNGKIIRFSRGRNSGTKVVYVFYYKNKQYNASSGTNVSVFKENRLINTYWPVLLSSTNPDLNEILMTEREFEWFYLQKPDTLMDVESMP